MARKPTTGGGNLWVQQFTGGLDSRRLPECAAAGTLLVATNGHLNRGNEFEKRAAFVPVYPSVAGTVGMAWNGSQIVVFGSAASVAVPTGVKYQRLQHPDGVTALLRILSWERFAAKLYVAALFADGSIWHFYDGTLVANWKDQRARCSVTFAGSAGGSITAMSIAGVNVIDVPIAWSGNDATFAKAVANAINAYRSDPDYTAVAVGASVAIVAADSGADANGRVVSISATGISVSPSAPTFAGGVTETTTYQTGPFVKTGNKKLFALSGSVAHFSGLNAPTKWFDTGADAAVGAGFVDLSNEASNSEVIVSVAKYQKFYAFFAERTTQIWYNDPDPTQNTQTQVLANTGTLAAHSVVQFGDNDLFYLDESGLRSLRARDASNAAATTDIGVPVDTLIIAELAKITLEDRALIRGIIEPGTGRYWLAIGRKIFVYTYFREAKVSAWSLYEPGFTVDEMMVFNRRVWLRSGDVVYAYGGASGDFVYDETVAEAWAPYLDANKPSAKKHLTGIDVACRGNWEVRIGMDLNNEAASDLIGRITETTYGLLNMPAVGQSTHFSARFKTFGNGPATLAAFVLHVQPDHDD